MATTISISRDLKEKLKNLGRTGDSYEEVIRKMYEITSKEYLKHWLYDETDTITIDEMKKEIKKKWPTSKSQKN